MVGDKPWYETFVPEGPTRDLIKSKNYANPVVVADSYYAANRMVNGNAIEIPPADAKPEAWDAIHKKLGWQEAPDKYTFKQPDGFTPDEGMVKFGQKMAYELRLDPARAQRMNDLWNEYAKEASASGATAQQAANEAEVSAVKQSWGADFDANMTAGKRAVEAVFAADKDKWLPKIEGAIGASAMLELFARLGKLGGEALMKGGGSGNGGDPSNPSSLTQAQAQAEIARLMADSDFQKAYTNPLDPQHKAKVQHMMSLHAAVASKPK